jgi:hypothetical protein
MTVKPSELLRAYSVVEQALLEGRMPVPAHDANYSERHVALATLLKVSPAKLLNEYYNKGSSNNRKIKMLAGPNGMFYLMVMLKARQ